MVDANYRGRTKEIGKVVVFSTEKQFNLLPINSVKPENNSLAYIDDNGHISFCNLQTEDGVYLLGFLHLTSKLNKDPIMQALYGKDYITFINQQKLIQQKKSNFKGTIITGDFNLNPFDISMYFRNGFHATNYLKSKEHSYYNPMFSLLGGHIYKSSSLKPAGTYLLNRLDRHDPYEIHWNLLDGVIFEPKLISNFVFESLQIVDKISDKHVLYLNEVISASYSDHLPIFYEFNL